MALDDFRSTDIASAPWWAIAGELTMWSMALFTFVIGLRFSSLALTGRSIEYAGRWLKPIVLGAGLFFPFFLVSLVVGLYWAYHLQSHGNPDDSALVALRVSAGTGVAAAIVGSAVMLARGRRRQ